MSTENMDAATVDKKATTKVYLAGKVARKSPKECRKNSQNSRNVRFGTVSIRQFAIRPGDNPAAAAGGPPLTIEWDAYSEKKFSLNDYENKRPGPPRRNAELIIPPKVRHEKLRAMGYSEKEIIASSRPANIVRNQRKRTNEMSHMYGISVLTERFGRAAWNVTPAGRRRKGEEKKVLDVYKKQNSLYLETEEDSTSEEEDEPEASA